jgi:hypothetical protein
MQNFFAFIHIGTLIVACDSLNQTTEPRRSQFETSKPTVKKAGLRVSREIGMDSRFGFRMHLKREEMSVYLETCDAGTSFSLESCI